MTTETTINKITVTAEAEYDYGCCLCERRPEAGEAPVAKLDKRVIKAEVEEYIDTMNRAGRLLHNRYFRCRYDDAPSGLTLMLFLYRAERLGIMQYWNLAGICRAGDWTEDAEDDGSIRRWLGTKVDDLSDCEDWAVCVRVNGVLQDTSKTKYENVLEEVKNAFECKRDKETAEKLVFLQNVHFIGAKRKRVEAKSRVNRKRDRGVGR
jgi:hypothetical protein